MSYPLGPPVSSGVRVESAAEERGVEAEFPAIDVKVATVGRSALMLA